MKSVQRVAVSRADIRDFGGAPLSATRRAELAELTTRLAASSSDSLAEFRRYLDVRRREISLPAEQLTEQFAGRTVLVTGDTGCIGSALVTQLSRFPLRRLVGASLTTSGGGRRGVVSTRLDVRDRASLDALIAEVAPDMVFHLAAQRDPGLAERAFRHTLTTNLFGTRNVVRACAQAGVPRLVLASTGKALRPYNANVYAASKRLCERIVADATAHGELLGSAVRFTHVVDNAILLDRLRRWCAADEVVRLHGLDTAFYVQSAVESAQLLLVAALAADGEGAAAGHAFRIHAIRDLGWPVNLLDLALGAVAESGASSAVQEVGPEPGYETEPYPGLYDPSYSGSVSPLFNAMEAPYVHPSASPDVDAAVCNAVLTPELAVRIARLGQLLVGAAPLTEVRESFQRLMWADLAQTARETPADLLHRITRLTAPYRPTMPDEHRHIDDVLRGCLPGPDPVAVPSLVAG